MTFGIRLKMAREHTGYTQIEVSKRTGINNKSLSHYENDLYSPDFESIRKLAKLYNVSTDYLFGLIDKFKHPEPFSYQDQEIQNIIDKYKAAPENIKNATKAMLEITSQNDVKKENIR